MSDLEGHDHQEDPHKPADDREEVYFQGSPMLRAEAGKVLGFSILGVVVIAIPWLMKGLQMPFNWWVAAACIPVGLLMILIPVLMQKTIRYRISNYRIDYEHGVAGKSIETLELWHVDDLSFHQSPADRLLNTGTITIMSHDKTTPQLTLHGIPHPRPVFESLKQRIIAVKRQRGVVKMDVG